MACNRCLGLPLFRDIQLRLRPHLRSNLFNMSGAPGESDRLWDDTSNVHRDRAASHDSSRTPSSSPHQLAISNAPGETDRLRDDPSEVQRDRPASHNTSRTSSPSSHPHTIPSKHENPAAGISPAKAVLITKTLSPTDQRPGRVSAARTTRQSNLLRIWWRELIACVIMFVMLFAILGTLFPYQGRPLPKWPYNLSVNTLVSVLVTVMKTSILFILAEGLSQLKWDWFRQTRPLAHLSRYDEASRGAWGCVHLLVTLKGKSLVATTGAVLVIISLVLDPLAQQLIHYVDCEVPSVRMPANLPRSSVYDEQGLHANAGYTTPSVGLISAVAAGVFNPGFIALPFDCPTGNCSFPQPYSTLGYCASCKDISHTIQVIPWNHTDLANNYTVQAINTTLPSGLQTLYAGGELIVGEEWFVMGFAGAQLEILLGASNETQSGTKISNSHDFASFAGLVGANDVSCPEDLRTSWGCQGPRAASCSLDLCTKSYTADVKEGKLQEKLMSSSTVWNSGDIDVDENCPGSDIWQTQADLMCLNQDQKSILRRIGYTFRDDDVWIPYNVSVDICTGAFREMTSYDEYAPPNLSKTEQSVVPADCIYQVSGTSASGIESYISTYFAGSVQPDFSGGSEWKGDSQFLAIFNNSALSLASITHTMENVAESITIYMRQHGNSNYSKSVSGSATTAATCIAVRWEWLAFPAVVVTVTSMFLIATLLKTELDKKDTTYRGWKSSVLPLVFHGWDGLEEKQSQHEGILLQRKEMDQAAQQLRVRLKGTGVAIEMQ